MSGSAHGLRRYAGVIVVALAMVGLVATSAIASTSSTTRSTCGTTASISLHPSSGEAGTPIVVTGTGFCAGTSAAINFRDVTGVVFHLAGGVPVAGDGTFSADVAIPHDAAIGSAAVRVSDRASKQCPVAPFEVTAPGLVA